MRNNILFRGDIVDVGEVVNNTKVIDWLWHIIGLKSRGCSNFYDCSKASLLYLNLCKTFFFGLSIHNTHINLIAYQKNESYI